MQKTEELTIIIGDDGLVVMIDSATSRVIAEDLGVTKTRRASHVEPDNTILRWLFHTIRKHVSDESRLAQWTRTWRCLWRVKLANEFGGVILPGRWADREEAIAAEVNHLNERFLTLC